jgi:CBS domain-containing protein
MYTDKTKVAQIMSTDLVTIDQNDLVTKVDQIFNKYDFHHIPVMDNDICIGVISKYDYGRVLDKFTLFGTPRAEFENFRFLKSLLAKEIMSNKVVELDTNASIQDALSISLLNKIHSIVIQEKGEIKGIVTPYDLLKIMSVDIEKRMVSV